MAMPWFRFYHEWDADPKVQMMSEPMQRRLAMLFCSQSRHETLQETERAFHWRITVEDVRETKALFLAKGFIDEQWNVVHWDDRQFLSDDVTERVRRHRQAKKQGETLQPANRNVSETANGTKCNVREQIQNRTDTEHKKKAASLFVLPEWISQEVWTAFEEMRRAKKKPLTDQARKNILAKLIQLEAQGCPVEDVLNESITNGWSGVFALSNGGAGNGYSRQFGNRGQARTDGNLDAARRAAAVIAGEDAGRPRGSAPGGGERGNAAPVLAGAV